MSTAQYAPVAPIQILETLLEHDRQELFGTYHLMLAHETTAQRDRFARLIHQYHTRSLRLGIPKPLTIIMDNSVVETGTAVDDNMIFDACEAVSEYDDLVIPCLPDVIGDGPSTVEASCDAYERWTARGCQYMMLLAQGKNWDEFVETVNYFFITHRNAYQHIQWVGIPRVLTASLGSRERAVKYVQMVAPHVQIHLFGFSDNMVDDFLCARNLGVRGIDSAVPLRATQVISPTYFVPPRDPRWFERGLCGPVQETNVRNVRKWVGGR